MRETTINMPSQPSTTIKAWRDDDPVPAVVVWNAEWEQELHVPVEIAGDVAAAIADAASR